MLLRIDNVIAASPEKKVHLGESLRKEAVEEGYGPVAQPSDLATQT